MISKTKLKLVLIFMVTLLFVSNFIPANVAYAQSKTYTFDAGSERTRSATINIPNLVSVNSVSVNTGNVNYSKNGENLTLNVSNGTAVSYDTKWSDTLYSYDYSTTRTSSSNSFSNSISVSNITNQSGTTGFGGTLNKSGSSYVNSGSYTAADTKSATDSDVAYGISEYTNNTYRGQSWTKYYNKDGYTGTLTGIYSSTLATQTTLARSFNSGFMMTTSCGTDITASNCTNYDTSHLTHPDANYFYNYIRLSNVNYSNIVVTGIGWTGQVVGPVGPVVSGCNINQDGSCTGGSSYTHYRDFNVSATYDELVRTYNYNVAYSGSVTKPASDNRVYAQNYSGTIYKGGNYYDNHKYAYTVTIDYVDNVAPTVSLNAVSGVYSQVPGYNTFNVSGNVNDREGNSTTIKYRIGSQTGILASNVASGSSWSGNVTVTSSIPEGNQTLNVWAEDGYENGVSDSKTTNVVIDKTGPSLSYTLSPSDWTTGSVTVTPSASDSPAGVASVSSPFTEVSNGKYTFSALDRVGNSSTASATISNIDKFAPDITFNKNSSSAYEKGHEVVVTTKDTKDGVNSGSGVKSNSYLWSLSSEFDTTANLTSFNSGSIIKTPLNVTGDYYLHVISYDNLNQSNKLTSSGKFLLDNTVPVFGSHTVVKNGNGSLKVSVTGANDSHSGLNGSDDYNYTVVDSAGVATNSGWVGNSHVFNNLKGNEKYKVTYKVRDKAGNISENNNALNIITQSYNAVSVTRDSLTTNSLKFSLNENILNLYGNTVTGSKYKVTLKDSNDKVVGTRDYNVSLKEILFNNLEINKPYKVFVNVKNNEGTDTDGTVNLGTFYTSSAIPGLVMKTVSLTNHNHDILNNSNPSGTSYLVQRSTNSNFSNDVTLNNWTNSDVVTSSTLTNGTDYYYRIKSRNAEQIESEWSPTYNYKTVSAAPNLTSANVDTHDSTKGTTNILLNWNSVAGAEKYYIYRDDVKISEVNSSTLTYKDVLTNFNKSYTYKVRAWNGLGSSADDVEWHDRGLSDASNSRTLYTRSHDALDIVISNMVGSSAYFNIQNSDKNSDVPNYYIEVRKKGSSTAVSSSSYSKVLKDREVKNLSYGVAYEIWIKSKNDDGIENSLFKIVDEFWMNRPPELNFYLSDNHTSIYKDYNVNTNNSTINKESYVPNDKYAIYSDNPGYDVIKLRGEMKDADYIPTQEPLEISYTIKNKSGNNVNGHSGVKLGQLGDLLGDVSGNWTELKYNNNVGKYLGLATPRFNNSLSAYDSKAYKVNDYLNIPVDSRLPDGEYTIILTLTDDQGDFITDSAVFKIDRTASKGDLVIDKKQEYDVDLIIDNGNFDIAGKDNKAYSLEYKINNEDKFTNLFKYQSSDKFKHNLNVNTQSNTKYTYRAILKDKAGNVSNSDIVEYVTSLKLKPEKGTDLLGNKVRYDTERPNTVNIEWENSLDINDGLQIEIYRSNKLINIIKEGDKYDDKNLDYERDYNYKIIVVGKDKNGSRLESLPIEFKVTTGSPVLITDVPSGYELDLDLNAYKALRPLFTKDVKISLDVEYKQGAEAEISYLSSINKYSNKFYFTLKPNIKNRINFIANGDDKEILDVAVLLTEINLEDGISTDIKFVVNEVTPKINYLDTNLKGLLYK